MTTELKEVDLDNIIEEFTAWQKFVSATQFESAQRETKIEALKKDVIEAQERENNLIEDAEQTRKLVDQLHDTLKNRCDLENENQNLKKQLSTMKDHMENQERDQNLKSIEMKNTIERIKDEHKVSISNREEELTLQGATDCAALQQIIKEKTDDIYKLEKRVADIEQEKHAEIVKMGMEHDSKLLKLQRHSNRLQQTSSGTVANQDIFRKKLQHTKAEGEREILTLKRTIADLQNELATAASRKTGTSTPRGLGLASKRKQY